MPLVPFQTLMQQAEAGGYAVGYFESWNLESLLAVADAAEAVRSPVILGFSGIYLPHPDRRVSDPLAAYAALGLEVGRRLSVPCCLLFNESPHLGWVLEAVELGFGLVMYTDEGLAEEELADRVRQVVRRAHAAGAAVEGEPAPLAGVAGDLTETPADRRLTDPGAARHFVEQTGVDALAVNVGQAHLHGRRVCRLDLGRLAELRKAVSVPLVLHGASSADPGDLREAVLLGVRKVNVSSRLKQAYFQALRLACDAQRDCANPYEVVGSGLDRDVLIAARLAGQAVVEEFMHCLGSSGRVGRGR
jgi:fructose/tagatose bisphosphate aldolase